MDYIIDMNINVSTHEDSTSFLHDVTSAPLNQRFKKILSFPDILNIFVE